MLGRLGLGYNIENVVVYLKTVLGIEKFILVQEEIVEGILVQEEDVTLKMSLCTSKRFRELKKSFQSRRKLWRGIILLTTIISTFSPPPGVENFRFPTFALCQLRDAEKETHKHKVLWEKCWEDQDSGITLKMSLCTSKRFVGIEKMNLVQEEDVEGCNNNNNIHFFTAARG